MKKINLTNEYKNKNFLIKNKEELDDFISNNFINYIIDNNIKIIALSGNLGVGKSYFSSIFIKKYLNNYSLNITSPTFNLINKYEINNKIIYHCDFYKLENNNNLYYNGFFDFINNELTLIEWPDIGREFYDKDKIINILITKNNSNDYRYLAIT